MYKKVKSNTKPLSAITSINLELIAKNQLQFFQNRIIEK